MNICHTIAEIRKTVADARAHGRSIAVVPTMGALHVGHAALIDAAVAENHFTVVTIFVNPTQFGPNEDFDRYPRTFDADLDLCRRRRADAVFAPAVAEIYPGFSLENFATSVSVRGLPDTLCGRSRPGHFDGVCTVVAKLFNIVAPDAAYFGQKDAQQAAIIQRMTADLNFPLTIRVCPTVRDSDGLALSSRNAYLEPTQRSQAPALYGALQLAASLIDQGQSSPEVIIAAMRDHIAAKAPLGRPDYIEIVDPRTLQPVTIIDAPVLIALAVHFGKTRLIDNLRVDSPRKKR